MLVGKSGWHFLLQLASYSGMFGSFELANIKIGTMDFKHQLHKDIRDGVGGLYHRFISSQRLALLILPNTHKDTIMSSFRRQNGLGDMSRSYEAVCFLRFDCALASRKSRVLPDLVQGKRLHSCNDAILSLEIPNPDRMPQYNL